MGRHEKDESKEDRLLRKAREYVKREEEALKRRGGGGDDDEGNRRPRKKRRRDDDNDSSEDDNSRKRKSRKHKKKKRSSRRRDDEDSSDGSSYSRKRSRKSERHKSSGNKLHKKHKRRSRDDEKEITKKIRVEQSKLHSLGPVRGQPPERPLEPDQDYFSYHQHLWVFLYRDEGVAFGDLTSEEAREAFERFCKRYNAGTLEEGYYNSVLPLEAIEECKTTRHKWSFQTNKMEDKSLQMIEEGVRKQTEYESHQPEIAASVKPSSLPRVDERENRRHKAAEERLAERVAHRRLRQHVQAAEEEFSGGKAVGRERQLEKRKELADKIHAASRDREDAVGELGDSEIYGDGDEFKAALAREKSRKARREATKDTRFQELQQKERDRQEAVLKSLGLTGITPGQKITIAPRDET